ncbi:hypothetical protein [Bacillus sp. 03113]|uniref:hypothetical protein n=1 Tax=Bacillus sp. 03113 TaxID=2578211 RepID=UPI001142983A|nr:hypothetical protein [Bacillus sp. 03113]
MNIFRKKITHRQAVAVFINSLHEDIKEIWPIFVRDLKEYGGTISDELEKIYMAELFLAITSLELISLKKVFKSEQVDLLYDLVVLNLAAAEDGFGEYAKHTIEEEYLNVIYYCTEHNFNFLDEMSKMLYHKIEIKTEEEKAYISPLILTVINTYLATNIGRWNKIDKKFKIKG